MIKLLLSLTLLILSCGNDSSNRSKVSGTNPKASDSPSSNSQSPNANGEENSQAENEEESSGPSREDTGFTCNLGEIKFKDDAEAVQIFKANSMFIEDKDENSNGGIFNYKAPNIAAQQAYAIGIQPEKAVSPGKSFFGLLSLIRGSQRLTSCAKENSKNYFNYISGNSTTPYVRNFEGTVRNIYEEGKSCSGDPIIKIYQFCVHVQN